jgi:hypothetical protein
MKCRFWRKKVFPKIRPFPAKKQVYALKLWRLKKD